MAEGICHVVFKFPNSRQNDSWSCSHHWLLVVYEVDTNLFLLVNCWLLLYRSYFRIYMLHTFTTRMLYGYHCPSGATVSKCQQMVWFVANLLYKISVHIIVVDSLND